MPDSAAPRIESEIVTAADGGRFGVTRIHPAGPVRGVAVYVPGMFTGRRFWLSDHGVGLAAWLAGSGLAGLIIERRGIGATRDAPGSGRPGLTEHLQHDLPLAQQLARDLHDDPAFWIGHSFGGVLAARAAGSTLDPDRIAGLVLFATQFEVGKTMLDTPANWLTRGLARAMGRFPARWVGLGPEDEPPAALHDACAIVSGGRRRPELRATLGRVTAPALAIVGAGDRVDPPAGCERFLGHLAGHDRTYVRAGAESGFAADFDHPGVVVSKPAQAEIWPLVADWIETRLP